MSSDVLLLLLLSAAFGVGEVVGDNPAAPGIDLMAWAKTGNSMILKLESDELKFTAIRPDKVECLGRTVTYYINECPVKLHWQKTGLQINTVATSDDNAPVVHTSDGIKAGQKDATGDSKKCLHISKAKLVYFGVQYQTEYVDQECSINIKFTGAIVAAADGGSCFPWIITTVVVVIVSSTVFIIGGVVCMCREKPIPKHVPRYLPESSVMSQVSAAPLPKKRKASPKRSTPKRKASPKRSKPKRKASPKSVEKTVESRRHCTDYSTEATE